MFIRKASVFLHATFHTLDRYVQFHSFPEKLIADRKHFTEGIELKIFDYQKITKTLLRI